MKFSTKLTLALVAAAVIPVGIVGYGMAQIQASSIRELAQEKYFLAAERVQERVNTHVQEKVQLLRNVANTLVSDNAESQALMQVRSLLAEAENVDALGIYDVRGEIVDAVVKQQGSTVPAKLRLNASISHSSGTISFLNPVFEEKMLMPAIPVLTPLVSNERCIGYLMAFVKTEDLCALVEQDSRRLFQGAPERISLLSDSLILLASSNRNAVQAAQKQGGATSALLGGDANSQSAFVGTLREYSNSQGTRMLGAALSVPLLRSVILVEEPTDIAYKRVREIQQNTVLWMLLCGFIAGVAGVFFSRELAKPLQELLESSSKLARRDFSVKMNPERKDEFATLFSEQNALAEELAKYERLNVNRIIAERNKLETMVRQAQDGIILLNAEKRIELLNGICAEWFALEMASEGLLLDDVLGEHDFTTIASDMLETQEVVRSVEFRLRKSGEVRELVLRGTLVKVQQNGAVLALMGLLRDVTHEVEIDRMKTDLVSIVAHELRSPLNSINGLAELIGEGELAKEESEEFGRTIAAQSKKLAGIISKFLDLSRMESGKAEVRRIPVRLDEIVRSVVAINSSLAQKKNISIDAVFPATTPPVLGDPDLLGQAVLNLFTNAVKYSEESKKMCIEIRLKASEIELSVKDEGFGISERAQSKLFTKFYRADDDERVGKNAGTGLGLAFVKEIALQHGGTVGVESKRDAGSRFWFTLPL
ncbi:MAG: HAMP domain-containing protein [Candidatus Kapaibacterium sp.]|nr:MAG: HAMP domain-containing protein [Candidatus Kapabacteria bacterium]